MHFDLKGYREQEGVVSAVIEAPSEHDAIRKAEADGYKILSLKARRGWSGLPRAFTKHRFPLVLFSQELLTLNEAGLSLVEAIESLAEKESDPDNRRLLGLVLRQLYEGKSFSQALAQFPAAFPELYVATIRASERTSDLKESLARYIAYQSQLDFVRKKVVSASIYPSILIVVGGLVTLFLMVYVVPRFSQVYHDIGTDLPLMSRLLMKWGLLLRENTTGVVLAACAVAGAGTWGVSRPALRSRLVTAMRRLPAVGERMHMYQLSRFYRTLGMLLRGGIPIVTALEMVDGLLHTSLRRNLQAAARDIREGQPISTTMDHHGLATAIALRMLRAGERSGNMGEMMERIAGFYDEELSRWVDWFIKLFEPLLMTLIGVVIGVIVLLMYMPIFELAGSLQ